MAEPGPRFTDKNLYGPSGHPRAADINQDALGDCFFVAPLGALAQEQPGRIENSIQYDAAKGSFTVTLYKEQGTGLFGLTGSEVKPVRIEVSQADIEYDIKRKGGSTMDNTGKDAPAWPAVLETAFAKMHDKNLEKGFDAIAEGGKAHNSMFALTGVHSEKFDRSSVESLGVDKAMEKLDDALKADRPVTLSTDPEKTSSLFGLIGTDAPQDGLVDNHVYMLERVYKDPASGEVMVQARNPWGSNQNVGEGHDTPNASITVKLKDIVEGGGLECFDIGPTPAQKAPVKTAAAGTGDRHLDSMLASLDNPAAMKESMRNLAGSRDGQEFAAHGQHQYREQQAAAAATVAAPEESQAASRNAPSMRP